MYVLIQIFIRKSWFLNKEQKNFLLNPCSAQLLMEKQL
jgi:hypothetical protein